MLTRAITSVCITLISVFVCGVSFAKTISIPQDHKTIQQGVDAAAAGDVVLVAAGSYRERIQLKEGVTLKSAGDDTKGKLGLKRAEATIIDASGVEGKGPGVAMAQGSVIDGFTVTGIGVYDEAKWQRHHATQGNEQKHEDIGVPGDAGIGMIGVHCEVKNNIVHHIGYTGIAVQGVNGNACSPHLYRNVCYRNMGGGIGSMQKSAAVIEENVCFENFYAGIGHDDASPTVINNVCYENIRAGIGISEGSCPVVRGNKCYKNRRAGIGTRTGANTRPIIEDNDCFENQMAGIGTDEEAAPMIRNNRCYKNKLAGIGSRNHASPTIVGNECYENQEAGIGQQSDAVTTLVNNYCHHNKAGLGFATCEAGRSTVVNNRLIDNSLVAMGVHAGWDVRVSGNEMSRVGGLPPIVMVFEGASATLENNVIRGGGVAGIRVAGKVRADRNEFDGTSLRKVGPPNFAIWGLPGSDVTMTGNKIHGWRHALHASEARVSASNNAVSEFHNAAFVVQQGAAPPNIYNNTATTKDPKSRVVSIKGEAGLVKDNRTRTP